MSIGYKNRVSTVNLVKKAGTLFFFYKFCIEKFLILIQISFRLHIKVVFWSIYDCTFKMSGCCELNYQSIVTLTCVSGLWEIETLGYWTMKKLLISSRRKNKSNSILVVRYSTNTITVTFVISRAVVLNFSGDETGLLFHFEKRWKLFQTNTKGVLFNPRVLEVFDFGKF